MQTSPQPHKLTFDDAAREINAVDKAIGVALSNQANAGDQSAWAIIDLYRKGIRQNGETAEASAEARTEFLGRYEDWRSRFAELVAPIASGLGHPLPIEEGETHTESPVSEPQDVFGGVAAVQEPQNAATDTGAGQEPASEPATPAAPAPAEPAKGGKRRGWSQTDIAQLTRRMLNPALGPEWTPAARAEEFITAVRQDFSVPEVLAKAVELELIEGNVSTGKNGVYEPTFEDKRILNERLVAMLPPELPQSTKLALLKAALVELKDLIKAYAG